MVDLASLLYILSQPRAGLMFNKGCAALRCMVRGSTVFIIVGIMEEFLTSKKHKSGRHCVVIAFCIEAACID